MARHIPSVHFWLVLVNTTGSSQCWIFDATNTFLSVNFLGLLAFALSNSKPWWMYYPNKSFAYWFTGKLVKEVEFDHASEVK